jgi:competence protein ComEC
VGALLFRLAAVLYEELWPALVWAADAPAALLRVAPAPWWYAFALLAALVLLRRWPWSLRLTGLAAVLPLICAPPPVPAPGVARVSILDAGRGGSALIVTRSHALLFDTGDTWNTHGARLSQVALPALAATGRESLDELVLPTLDPDRALAGALLANERGLGRIRVGGGWPATSLPATTCRDSGFYWDGVRFEIFATGARARYCVLRISVGDHAILFGGDADGAAERALTLRLLPGALASDAVIMSRHGSSQGSSAEWIEASGARLCVAAGGSAASGSRAVAIERWWRAGAQVLDTRRDGAIELDLGTTGVAVLRRARWSQYPFAWRRSYQPAP